MEVLQKFREVVNNPHEYARCWKERTGNNVFGYLSSYTPEEIIYAANILPVRILSSHNARSLDATLPYLSSTLCPYSRGCLAQGIGRKYEYLDGIVYAFECHHMLATYSSWHSCIPISYKYNIYVPRILESPFAKDCIVKELEYFKRSLEEWRGQTISREAINEAIKIYNTNRRLLHDFYNIMRGDNPPFSGVEALEITLASQLMDKKEHSELLVQVLREVPKVKHNESAIRLMIIGPEFDDREFVRLTESLGCKIVFYDLDTGCRYFWGEAPLGEGELYNIATRFVEKPPSPTKDYSPKPRRFQHVLHIAKDFRCQGAIILQRVHCDSYHYDNVSLKSFLMKNDIPSLIVDFWLTVSKTKLHSLLMGFLKEIQRDSEVNPKIFFNEVGNNGPSSSCKGRS